MVHRAAAVGFARSADAYERARPDYPPDAIGWLAQRLGLHSGATVVDLAAGTGKLTRPLLQTGARVLAVEPLAEMRAAIGPPAQVVDGTAERMPLPTASADAVTVGQAFHWFDGDAALTEIHRVLRPGGALALVWNRRPLEHPLHAAIEAILAPHRGDAPAHGTGAWRTAFEHATSFGPLQERSFRNAQLLDADALSFVAALDRDERERVLAEIRALAADGPVQLPLVTEVHVCDRRG